MNKADIITELNEKVDEWWSEYNRLLGLHDCTEPSVQRALGHKNAYLGAIAIVEQYPDKEDEQLIATQQGE